MAGVAAAGGAGAAAGPVGIESVYREITRILGIGTSGEITTLLNKIDVSGQRRSMNQRNRYIIGNVKQPIPLYPLLDIFKRIPKVTFEGKPVKRVDYPLVLPRSGAINYRFLAGGGYGEIYKSVSNVMKQIIFQLRPEDGQSVINMTLPTVRRRENINAIMPVQIENERASRTFLIELIIQIILHSDPEIGNLIPAVHNVYVNQSASFAHRETRSGNVEAPVAVAAPELRRRTQAAARAAEHAATVERERVAAEARHAAVRQALNAAVGNKAYITMEFVDHTLDEYCNDIYVRNGNRSLNLLDIAPIFRQLGNLLERLKTKYNFRHGDLHSGNIMVTSTGEIRLIDFGMSCMIYNGLTLKVLNDWERYDLNSEVERIRTSPGVIAKIGGCDSYDLLIFVTSFIENESTIFSPTGQNELKSLFNFTLNGVNHNLYDLLEDRFTTQGQGVTVDDLAVFHLTYPLKLDLIKFPIGPAGDNIKLRDICEMIPHIRSPALFRDRIDALIAAPAPAAAAPGYMVAAARGPLPAAPPRQQGFLRKCFGPLCPNWFGGGTRKPKHARRARQTRRFRVKRRI